MRKRKKKAGRVRGGASFLCPHRRCGKPTRVRETRLAEDGGSVRRRRVCPDGHVFRTGEQVIK